MYTANEQQFASFDRRHDYLASKLNLGKEILWMTKESSGTQKLEKEARGIFWRYVPFPQALKDDLKKRSMVYQELYQRDINRSMSDGY